jgi:predicted HD phosphohydrolase
MPSLGVHGLADGGKCTGASKTVENVAVNLSLDDIQQLLDSAAQRPVEGGGPGSTMPFSHLDHALQTAAVLKAEMPDDLELAVAGLVHDIGHLLVGVGDAEHAAAGAEAVRGALGERVAGLVGLHVAAKRYLVARQSAYAGTLAADSVASLAHQGGPMSPAEQDAFERLPDAQDALTLRRADESGKVDGLVVVGLTDWIPVMRRVSAAAGAGAAGDVP